MVDDLGQQALEVRQILALGAIGLRGARRRRPLSGVGLDRSPRRGEALLAAPGRVLEDHAVAEHHPILAAEEAELRLGEFEAKWDADYLPIGQSWRRNWSRLTPFFDYPPEIRKVIYTTNAIESVNMGLRKLSKNRGSFPSDEALTKLFYLALRNISQKWSMPIRDWKAALNRFTIEFGDRICVN